MNSLFSTLKVLSELEEQRFCGVLEIQLEAGRIMLLRKTENIKPEGEIRRNSRGEHGE